MIIIGIPKVSELDQYYMADGDMAWLLHQRGFLPKYSDEGCFYFKKNNKLIKFLEQMDAK